MVLYIFCGSTIVLTLKVYKTGLIDRGCVELCYLVVLICKHVHSVPSQASQDMYRWRSLV